MPSTMPCFSINSEQLFKTSGTKMSNRNGSEYNNLSSVESRIWSLCVLLPSSPELRRCSPRSQPKTRSFRMPLCFSFCLLGLDFMKARRKPISLPCFLETATRGRQRNDKTNVCSFRSSFLECDDRWRRDGWLKKNVHNVRVRKRLYVECVYA